MHRGLMMVEYCKPVEQENWWRLPRSRRVSCEQACLYKTEQNRALLVSAAFRHTLQCGELTAQRRTVAAFWGGSR